MKLIQVKFLIFVLVLLICCGKIVEEKAIAPNFIETQEKDSLTYNLDVKLEIIEKIKNQNENYHSTKNNSSLYLIAISIKNLSADTFPICYMNCSFEETFMFYPSNIKKFKICDGNYLSGGFLLKNERISFITSIFDPTQIWYLQNYETIRIGFVLKRIKIGNTFINLSKEKHQVYWSNEVNLRNKIPTYHFYEKEILYLDSLNNKLENYFRYPFCARY